MSKIKIGLPSCTDVQRWEINEHGGTEKLFLHKSVKLPALGLEEVLIKVLATTATYTDQLIIRGNYINQPSLPITPGYDCIGVIEKVGNLVKQKNILSVGDMIAAMPTHGCMSTHIILNAKSCIKINTTLHPTESVSVLLTGVTAYQLLHRCTNGNLNHDSKIVIHGITGGTGSMILKLALIAGVRRENIFGTCLKKNMNCGSGGQLGVLFSNLFDYSDSDHSWEQRVLKATGGKGVDFVFDHVCLNGYYHKGHLCLRSGGKYIAYGMTNTSKPGSMPMREIIFLFLSMTLQNYLLYIMDYKSAEFYSVGDRKQQKPQEFEEDFRLCLELLEQKKLEPLVGKIWSFHGANKALESIEKNEHVGKQIIQCDTISTIS